MFSTGMKLMLVGMLMVLFFLLLMVLLIKLIEILNRSHTLLEEQQINQDRQASLKPVSSEKTFPAEVMVAAVAAYEAERRHLQIP